MRLEFRPTAALAAAIALWIALWPTALEAHLNSTGLGPIYDGGSHLLLSPEDLVGSCTRQMWCTVFTGFVRFD